MRIAFLSLLGLGLLGLPAQSQASEVWTVRVEEPTGLYPRTNEVVAAPYPRIGGRKPFWRVVDAQGRELPWQAADDALLFPATLIPGELPEYRIAAVPECKTNFVNPISLRKIGLNRVELGNSWFRLLIDLRAGAIIEAYHLGAEAHRTVNLVETTPEDRESLKDDIHAAEAMGFEAVPGVPEANLGWTSLGSTGSITQVEFVERGPLRGKVRLSRPGETWEFIWTADGRAVTWQASKGFRFTSISAAPFLPFDRCLGGSEYQWPNGPDDEEPPDHAIAPRAWPKLPGGHAVYYCNDENYGALGVAALDAALRWTGVGSRKFLAEKAEGPTQIAITFPPWQSSSTVLAARREYRVLRQPLLTEFGKTAEDDLQIRKPAERAPETVSSMAPAAPAAFSPDAVSLDGDWELAWCEKGCGPPANGWRKVKVPGSAHIQWLDPSQIYSRDAEWVSLKEWWYRREFTVPMRFVGQQVRLEFGATDYYADTWLNGARLGRHEGYVDPYAYDITAAAPPGTTNQLLVRTWTPVDYYWKHRPYTVKGAYGAVDQKPDDITPLGITRPVRLVASAAATIKDLAVDTRLLDDGSADVEVTLEFDGPELAQAVEMTLCPRNFTSDERPSVRLSVAGRAARAIIHVPHPQLWWTWDHGRPNLYTLEVRLKDPAGRVLDARSLPVGIREIERIGWTFYLNRRRMFIRGTNYYYNLYLSEMTRAAYERDLGLMLQMNVNLIRLHCHFENPEFYQVADELGVLIWQDYLEAWYPEDRAFSLRAAALYDPLIRSVRNHPCIATWAVCDEDSLENYRDLGKHLAARAALLDPQRRAIVRSTGRFGDAHVYHGWYGGSLWEYTKMTEPFVSELGATCLPNYETLIRFMPHAWPIRDHAEEWFFRRLQIPEAMRAWGEPGNATLQEYIPRTQAYVSRLFQIALERSRRLKYHPAGGICHFHAIDIWPSVTMAAIDVDRRPTQVFYTVQRSFAPICASVDYDRDAWKTGEALRCPVWAINDNWDPLPNATVRWRILDSRGGEQASGLWRLTLPEDSVQCLGNVEWTTAAPGHYELYAQVRNQGDALVSENLFSFEVR